MYLITHLDEYLWCGSTFDSKIKKYNFLRINNLGHMIQNWNSRTLIRPEHLKVLKWFFLAIFMILVTSSFLLYCRVTFMNKKFKS